MQAVTRTFLKGLAAVLPITITIYAVVWLATSAENALRMLVPDKVYFPGMGVVVGLAIVYLIGVLLNAWIAGWLFSLIEKLLDHIPLVKSLYGSMKDLLGFFIKGDQKDTNQVVMVTLGDNRTRILGLMTRQSFTDLPEGVGTDQEVAVYLPMSYQLGGFTVMVPRETVKEVDMTTEQALRFAVTAGMTSTNS